MRQYGAKGNAKLSIERPSKCCTYCKTQNGYRWIQLFDINCFKRSYTLFNSSVRFRPNALNSYPTHYHSSAESYYFLFLSPHYTDTRNLLLKSFHKFWKLLSLIFYENCFTLRNLTYWIMEIEMFHHVFYAQKSWLLFIFMVYTIPYQRSD